MGCRRAAPLCLACGCSRCVEVDHSYGSGPVRADEQMTQQISGLLRDLVEGAEACTVPELRPGFAGRFRVVAWDLERRQYIVAIRADADGEPTYAA